MVGIENRLVLKKTKRNWLQSVAAKKWESIGETKCENEMATQFSNLVNEALDEIAPVKTFSISPGLS